MSTSWVPDSFAGFRITRMSRRQRIRRKARHLAQSKRTRAIAALLPAVAAGAMAFVRLRRGRKTPA